MATDDLFARLERALINSRLLRDERRALELGTAKTRRGLRSAVTEMAELRAAIRRDRGRCSARADEVELAPDIERLECVRAHIRSHQELLRSLRRKILN